MKKTKIISLIFSFCIIVAFKSYSQTTSHNVLTIQNISDSLKSWTEKKEPVGVEVLILKNNETILHKAYGWKSLENNIELDTNSIFRVASMTKPLTATGILILEDEKKLNTKNKISVYIPEFQNIAGDSLIIENFLRHQSGYTGHQIWKDYGEELRLYPNLDKAIKEIASTEPSNDIGTEEYSSINSMILAQVIHNVTKNSPEKFLRDRIIKPLNMNSTYLLDVNSPEWLEKVPTTYEVENGEAKPYWVPKTDSSMYPFFRGATGCATTARDYSKFLKLWLNKGEFNGIRILKEETVLKALDNQSKGFGLHWMIPQTTTKKSMPAIFGHTGWYGTHAAAIPEDNGIIIYLTQTYNKSKIDEFNKLLSMSNIFKHDGPYDLNLILPEIPNQPDISDLKKYTGIYESNIEGTKWKANIEVKNGHLLCKISSKDESWIDELALMAENTFAPAIWSINHVKGIYPKVFYHFNSSINEFEIRVLNQTELIFQKI